MIRFNNEHKFIIEFEGGPEEYSSLIKSLARLLGSIDPEMMDANVISDVARLLECMLPGGNEIQQHNNN